MSTASTIADDRAPSRVVITGGASGIGRAAANLAADAGAALCLVDRDAAGLAAAAEELAGRAAAVSLVEADLVDPSTPETVIARAVEALGGLDALISNAGFPIVGPLLEITPEEFDRAHAINLRATWLLARAAHPWLKES